MNRKDWFRQSVARLKQNHGGGTLAFIVVTLIIFVTTFAVVMNVSKQVNARHNFQSMAQSAVEDGVKTIDTVGFLHYNSVEKIHDSYMKKRAEAANSNFMSPFCNENANHGDVRFAVRGDGTKFSYQAARVPRITITLSKHDKDNVRKFTSKRATWVFVGDTLVTRPSPEAEKFDGYNIINAKFDDAVMSFMGDVTGLGVCQKVSIDVNSVRFLSDSDVDKGYER